MPGLLAGTIYDRPPVCERCQKPESECRCPPLPRSVADRAPAAKQTARIAVEKRKKGKVVSVVRGLAAADNDLAALLSKLKSACGAGGTIAGDELEIQGDHRDKLAELLGGMGYKTRS